MYFLYFLNMHLSLPHTHTHSRQERVFFSCFYLFQYNSSSQLATVSTEMPEYCCSFPFHVSARCRVISKMTPIFTVWQVNSQLYSLKLCALEDNSVFLQKRKEPAAAQKQRNMFCGSKMWVAKLHQTPACITADALCPVLCYFILFLFFKSSFFFPFEIHS